MNRAPFSIDEWYHCYNRGVDKRTVFEDSRDYERFLLLMYVCNGTKSVHISNLRLKAVEDAFTETTIDRGEALVEIGAYCLMRNHVHLLLREAVEGGIARFMQKVGTGYSMYFNTKYERTGALFGGAFKSRHVNDDRYLRKVVPYIHFNPLDLLRDSVAIAEKKLKRFAYSSYKDFLSPGERPQSEVIGSTLLEIFADGPSLREQLRDAKEYAKIIKVSP